MKNAAPATRPSPFGADDSGLPSVFLLPGTLHCAAEPSVVTTVLGSCVAVCLSDRSRRLSGINHFVLPHGNGDRGSLRYGDVAIDRLIARMLALGALASALEAKVFGGAAVLHTRSEETNVGAQNVETAVERLAAAGIPIVGRRTGGRSGIAIRLYTGSGRVMVRPVDPSATGGVDD